jgi:diguanylate cyclase (GGDEF)-like protein/PAS domain S-box-containing protein
MWKEINMFENKNNTSKQKNNNKKSLKFQRIILLVIPYFYFVFGLFLSKASNIDDPMTWGHRTFAMSIFLSLYILSFISTWVKKRLKNLIYLAVYLAIIHLAYVAYLNSYNYDIAISLVVTIAIVNLFFKGNNTILIYNILTAAAVLISLIFTEKNIYFRILFFSAFFSTAAFTYFISYQKLKSEDKLSIIAEEQDILLNNIDVQIWYLKRPDKFAKVNQAYADFLGLTRTEIENSRLDKILPQNIAKRCREDNENVFSKKEKLETEEWIKNHKGESRFLSITKTPKLDENGDIDFVVCSAEDITEIKEKSKILNNIFNNVGIAYWSTDVMNNEVVEVSKSTEKVYGYPLKKWYNDPDFWYKIIYYEDKERIKNSIDVYKNKDIFENEYRVYKENGEVIWTKNYIIPIKNSQDDLVRLDGLSYDITKQKEAEEEIKYLLYRDVLTELYNRRFFEEEIERLDTKRQLPISIIMADVNGLKIINDTFGHEKGDEMLTKAAQLLENVVREEDILARHGGDEFSILLPQTNKKEAEKILNRIKKAARKTENEEIPISISFGVSTKSSKSEDIYDILKQADNAMYQNKLLEGKSAKNKIIQGILSTLSAKSSETKDHALRMITLAHDLGKNQDLSISELDRLSLLAMLHDIGKATISEEILIKPEKLTDKEWEIMKKHSETGSRIASATNEFALVAEEILSHHERWDGSGYPRRLKEEEIPYLARIITIIDAYDVMTNDRPYSKAISKEEALKEIGSCAGSQFDPKLAEAFVKMMRDN